MRFCGSGVDSAIKIGSHAASAMKHEESHFGLEQAINLVHCVYGVIAYRRLEKVILSFANLKIAQEQCSGGCKEYQQFSIQTQTIHSTTT